MGGKPSLQLDFEMETDREKEFSMIIEYWFAWGAVKRFRPKDIQKIVSRNYPKAKIEMVKDSSADLKLYINGEQIYKRSKDGEFENAQKLVETVKAHVEC